jgi:phosphoenolpyruvate-protein kinase (PTS system EI component)
MHHLQYPSVLRLIALTIQAGNRARIPVAMCGEMAGDPRYTRLLLGFGLDEFSMHPATLLQVKQIVRGSRHALLRKFAGRVLQAIKVSGTIIARYFWNGTAVIVKRTDTGTQKHDPRRIRSTRGKP